MKSCALLVLALATAGCASGRDYTSNNREGLAFLGESIRDARALRQRNLARTLQFGRRAATNFEQRRQGRRFLAKTIVRDEIDNVRRMLRGVRRELAWPANFGASLRFGHLDSGE